MAACQLSAGYGNQLTNADLHELAFAKLAFNREFGQSAIVKRVISSAQACPASSADQRHVRRRLAFGGLWLRFGRPVFGFSTNKARSIKGLATRLVP